MGSAHAKHAVRKNVLHQFKVVFLGLDNSGKTTALYLLKSSEMPLTVPTEGFNHEVIKWKGAEISIWDVGGMERLRPLWGNFLHDLDLVLFFVDASEPERLEEVRSTLYTLATSSMLKGKKILVVAAKQDRPRAATAEALRETLALGSLPLHCDVFPFTSTAGREVRKAFLEKILTGAM